MIPLYLPEEMPDWIKKPHKKMEQMAERGHLTAIPAPEDPVYGIADDPRVPDPEEMEGRIHNIQGYILVDGCYVIENGELVNYNPDINEDYGFLPEPRTFGDDNEC